MLYIPSAAGTMVVGMVARTPPVRPPNFSIAIVTSVATIPANNAERRIDVSNMVTQTDRCGQFAQCQYESIRVPEHYQQPSSAFVGSIQRPLGHSSDLQNR